MGQEELRDLQPVVDRLKEEIQTLRSALETTESGRVLLRQREEFSRLLSVSKMIVSELDLARVYEQVADSAREIVHADTVIVPMLNEGRDQYTYAAASGVDADIVRGSSFGAHVGMCGWVLRNSRSLLFGETSTHWMDDKTPWEAGQQSAVLVPLMGRKGIIGGLSALGKQGGGCFTQHDLDLLTMFANQVSIAIENARLFQQVKQEIEERTQAEQALHESKSMLQQILNTMPQSVFWKDRDSVYLGCNDVFARDVGLDDPGKIVGKTDFDLPWPKNEAEAYRSDDREVILNDRPKLNIIEPLQQSDGTRLWIDTSKVPLHDREGRVFGVLGVYGDVTGRKAAEEKLRSSENFIRTILNTVDEGFIVMDREFRIQTANRAYCDQIPLPLEEVIGKHCYTVSHGRSLPCFEEGEPCAVQKAFEDGNPHAVLHKHRGPQNRVMFVESKAFPLKDGSGRVTSAIEVITNITERQLLEEERLKTQKLEAVGTLAGGIAHDFNNLLQGVFGYISLAKLKHDDREKSLAALVEAEKALHMSVKLTNQLLTFSKGGKPAKKTIDLLPVIENAAKFALSGSRTDYRIAADDSLWQVDADEGQISQVIQNIVLNADQAMPESGRIDITVRNAPVPGPNRPQGLDEGNYVAIAIRDMGIGIAERYLAKIFDPYFTTKEKGSGLGLATSYSIIKNHNGAIDVQSEVGKGTTFSLYLPAAAAVRTTSQARPSAAASAQRMGRVLVMDDDEVVRDVAGALIGELGHRVEVAVHGREVIEKYREAQRSGDPFDVVILDLTIRGGMGGAEAVKKLREIDPQVTAVVSSGYSDDAGIAGYLEQGFTAFLKKPYDVDELQDVLNRLLKS